MAGNSISNCPTHDQLQFLLDNSKPTDETITDHVETCVECQRELDQLTDSAELTIYRRHSDGQRDATRYLDPPIQTGDLGSLNELAIERQIGAGGMGVVFQGRDDRLSRRIAVKVLPRQTGANSNARFLRESKAAAKLTNDHVVPVYSAGRTRDGTPYLVMQLIEGLSLKDRIALGTIPPREAASLIRQIALGLDAAHSNDLVHRDVKPANILLDDFDSRAKLTDFGLARTIGDDAITQANVITGTPEYMSPEQISNPDTQDCRGDIYSLGITLYECLTGTTPFRGQPIQVLEQHRYAEPVPLSGLNSAVPRDLENICLMSIAKEPKQRYQTAEQFADDLQRFLNGQPVVARQTATWKKFYLWCRRNRGIAALAATSIALLLALGIGSSVAAWRLGSANTSILAANAVAEREKQKANAAETLAVNDRTAAITALETLVDSLYDELTNDAATIRTREKILTTAIEGLKSITQVAADQKVDSTTVRAYQRIGDLTSLRGANQEAELYFDKAIDLSRVLLNQSPDNIQLQRGLAIAISKLATHYVLLQDEKATALCEESAELLRRILKSEPDDFDAQTSLAFHHGQILDINRGSQKKVIEYGESILPDVERLFEQPHESIIACSAAQKIHFCIGRAYLELNNAHKANEHFSAARTYLDQAILLAPENIQLRTASAVLNRAQAMVMGGLGKLDESIVLYANALETLQELSALDPENRRQHQQIANTRCLMGTALYLAGQHEQAIEMLELAIAFYQDSIRQSPNDESSRLLIGEARLRISEYHLRLNRWLDAHETFVTVQREMDGFEFGDVTRSHAQSYIEIAEFGQEATARLLGYPIQQKSSTAECIALMLAARKDAQTATSDLLSDETMALTARISPGFAGTNFLELFSYVHDLNDVFPIYAVIRKPAEARIFGMLARNYAESNLPDASRLSSIALQHCLTLIDEFAASFPLATARQVFLNEADLKWVRKTVEFEAAWANITESAE